MGTATTEPRIVVTHREHLWWLLAEAAQLEHMIMCQYLYAEFTLKDAADGLTPEQTKAISGWRRTLRTIAVEEMLHLALVCNLMSAIGAAPSFWRPNFPQRSGHFPSGLQLDLLPFGERALSHFLYLERPEGMERHDAEGFVPGAPPLEPVAETELMPRGQEFATIGHLYRGIEDGLRTLAARFGERALFVGSPRAQATPELFGGWKQLVAVTDLASALKAVEEIIEQGEGARGDWRDAHYGRFLAIWEEHGALRSADPSFEPARPVLAARTRQPYDVAVPVPIVTDPLTHAVAETAAVAYETLLHVLLRLFTHTDETDEQLRVLVGAALPLMSGVLRPLATALTTLPVGPEHPGRSAGFSFEMFYVMSNLVPWREPAWALLHERLGVLTHRCETAAARAGAPAAVRTAGQRAAAIAATIGAHVPEELRPVSLAG
jgi:hypothetical protein